MKITYYELFYHGVLDQIYNKLDLKMKLRLCDVDKCHRLILSKHVLLTVSGSEFVATEDIPEICLRLAHEITDFGIKFHENNTCQITMPPRSRVEKEKRNVTIGKYIRIKMLKFIQKRQQFAVYNSGTEVRIIRIGVQNNSL